MSAISILFLVGFAKVAARAYQQKNVMHDNWLAIIPTSYVMAFMELGLLGVAAIDIVNNGMWRILPLALAYGTGGWLGAWAAMWLHNRLNRGRQ